MFLLYSGLVTFSNSNINSKTTTTSKEQQTTTAIPITTTESSYRNNVDSGLVIFSKLDEINRKITTTTTSKPTSTAIPITTTTTTESYRNNVAYLTELISRCIRSNNYWSCMTDHSAKTSKSRKYVY